MADNTRQWDWMVKIVGEWRETFASQNVFVTGGLLWYPDKANNKQALDGTGCPAAKLRRVGINPDDFLETPPT